MKRVDVLRGILDDMQLFDPEIEEAFNRFNNKNTELSEVDFYAKFHEEFPWVGFFLQNRMRNNIRMITNSVIFFVVLTCLSALVYIIMSIAGASSSSY
jgi:hypothetical protein